MKIVSKTAANGFLNDVLTKVWKRGRDHLMNMTAAENEEGKWRRARIQLERMINDVLNIFRR